MIIYGVGAGGSYSTKEGMWTRDRAERPEMRGEGGTLGILKKKSFAQVPAVSEETCPVKETRLSRFCSVGGTK